MQEQRQYLQQTLPNGCVVIKQVLKWGPLFETNKNVVSESKIQLLKKA
jgi:hypothetical protein